MKIKSAEEERHSEQQKETDSSVESSSVACT